MSEMLIRMDATLEQVKQDVAEIKADQRSNYVSKTEFSYHGEKIKKLEDGLTWLLRSVIGVVVYEIMKVVIEVR